MAAYWWKDPKVLIDTPLEFLPNMSDPMPKAYNALLRFTAYGGVLLWLLTRNSLYIAVIPVVAVLTYVLHVLYPPEREHLTLRDHVHNCTRPTANNPFGNMLPHERADNPERGPVCATSSAGFESAMQQGHPNPLPAPESADARQANHQHALQRAFVAAPVTTSCTDLDAYKAALCGGSQTLPSSRLEGYFVQTGHPLSHTDTAPF